MATTQLGVDSSVALGKFLQKVYSDGITNQISEDFRDWEMVNKLKVSDQAARSVDFLINKTYGAPAVQWKDSGSVVLPSGSQSSTEEGSAGFNQLYSTVELEYDLWERAKSGAKKYLEPLAHEIQNKGIVQKRILSANFHLDGTGIMGEVGSTTAVASGASGAGSAVVISLASLDASRGGERYIEFGDELIMRKSTGAVSDVDTSFYAAITLSVSDKDRDANTITVVDAAGVADLQTSLTLETGGLFFRVGSTYTNPSAIVTTGAAASRTEYNSISEAMPGLETLTATDGRKIHGLTLDGVYKGQHYDASAAPVDISHIQKSMDGIKSRNGSSFKYQQVLCAPETLSAFIESNEADRRLVANTDKERGFKGFCFVHGNDQLELATSEFAGDKRMWVIPNGAAGNDCLELHGKDFKEINVGGSEYLKNTTSGYETTVQKFMMGYMTMICKRPGAILKIHNFEN